MKLTDEFIGTTISKGTLKIKDLIQATGKFLDDLEYRAQVMDEDGLEWTEEDQEMLDMVWYAISYPAEHSNEDDRYLWAYDISEYLNSIAPEGCSFGSHEGDGSLFGFWPSQD